MPYFSLPSITTGFVIASERFAKTLIQRFEGNANATFPSLLASSFLVNFGAHQDKYGSNDVLVFATQEEAIVHQIVKSPNTAFSSQGIHLIGVNLNPGIFRKPTQHFQYPVERASLQRYKDMLQHKWPEDQLKLADSISRRLHHTVTLEVEPVDTIHFSTQGKSAFKVWKIDSGLKDAIIQPNALVQHKSTGMKVG